MFDPTSPTWTRDNALYCLDGAEAVYGIGPWQVIDRGSYIEVHWQGSKTIQQWLDDAKAWQVQLPGAVPGIMVEAGFWREYMLHASAVKDAIDAIQQKHRALFPGTWLPVLILGHSLGGGLSHIHATQIEYPLLSVYTFGKPRVWNKAGADWFNAKFKSVCYDFAAKLDVVTRMPVLSLGWPPRRFALDGTRILLQGDGKYVQDPPLLRRLTLDALWLVTGWLKRKWLGPVEVLEDHHLASYRPLVEGLK